MNKIKIPQKYWLILLIISFAFILRIWKIEDLFYFSYDESIPAFVGRRLILWHHIPLIGGVTPFGFHLTPYFYWFLGALLFVGKLNPLIWGVAGAAISVVTVALIYKVGTEIESKKVGLTAAAIWAFSYLANLYDRHLWALYFGPLISLVVIWSLVKIAKGKIIYVYLLTAALIVGLSGDLSNFIFVILTVFAFVRYKLPLRKEVFVAFAIFVLSFVPLIAFDLRHNAANIGPALDKLTVGKSSAVLKPNRLFDSILIFPRTTARLIYAPGDSEVAKNYSYCAFHIEEKYRAIPAGVLIAVSVFLTWVVIFVFRSGKMGWQLGAVLLLIYFFGIQFYYLFLRGEVYEHYLVGLFPLLVLFIAKAIDTLPRKLMIVVMLIFIAFNLMRVARAQSGLGLGVKREAIEYAAAKVGSDDFSLDSLSSCLKYGGYRYLFAVFGREPVKSYVDPNFSYLYGPTPVAAKHPKTVVAFVLHDYIPENAFFYQRYELLKSHERQSATFGDIEVIVLDNSTDWFQ